MQGNETKTSQGLFRDCYRNNFYKYFTGKTVVLAKCTEGELFSKPSKGCIEVSNLGYFTIPINYTILCNILIQAAKWAELHGKSKRSASYKAESKRKSKKPNRRIGYDDRTGETFEYPEGWATSSEELRYFDNDDSNADDFNYGLDDNDSKDKGVEPSYGDDDSYDWNGPSHPTKKPSNNKS